MIPDLTNVTADDKNDHPLSLWKEGMPLVTIRSDGTIIVNPNKVDQAGREFIEFVKRTFNSPTVKKVDTRADFTTKLARIVHQANKAYCESIGDTSQVDWEDASESIQKAAKSGVKAIIDNPNVTPADLHDAWSKERMDDGWVYGEVKDEDKKTHPCLVPYDKLPPHQRFKDHLFNNIVKTYVDFMN